MTTTLDTPTTRVDDIQRTSPSGPDAQTPAGADADTTATASGDGRPDGQLDELPEWVRKSLTRANAEAANYRTRLREAEARLAEAKTPAEVEAALVELREKNAELERSIARSEVARRVGLPDELAQRLRGDTPQELEADAKALLRIAIPSTAPVALRGGLDPSDEDDGETDPGKLARKYGRRR